MGRGKKRNEVIVTDKIKSRMDYGSEFLPLVDYFDENAVTPLKELVCVATEQVEENKEEMESSNSCPLQAFLTPRCLIT